MGPGTQAAGGEMPLAGSASERVSQDVPGTCTHRSRGGRCSLRYASRLTADYAARLAAGSSNRSRDPST